MATNMATRPETNQVRSRAPLLLARCNGVRPRGAPHARVKGRPATRNVRARRIGYTIQSRSVGGNRGIFSTSACSVRSIVLQPSPSFDRGQRFGRGRRGCRPQRRPVNQRNPDLPYARARSTEIVAHSEVGTVIIYLSPQENGVCRISAIFGGRDHHKRQPTRRTYADALHHHFPLAQTKLAPEKIGPPASFN